MGALAVHTLEQAEGQAAVRELWDRSVNEAGDVYYDRSYLRSAEAAGDGQVLLCIDSSEAGLVLYPILRRSLAESGFDVFDDAGFDIITPYEYGGPLAIPRDPAASAELAHDFNERFGEYVTAAGIISEFVRFHPILETHVAMGSHYRLDFSCPNVVIELGEHDFFNSYSRANRRDVRLAERRGVIIERHPAADSDAFAEFVQLYRSSMLRLSADDDYNFRDEYFSALQRLDPALISLYLARSEGHELVAVALFVHSGRVAHFHLSGRVDETPERLYSMNLLLHTAAGDMQREGREVLHLGGAATDQPGLMDFKNRFSDSRRDYYVGKRVHNEMAYAALCEQSVTSGVGTDRAKLQASEFFPRYRAGAPLESGPR